MGVSNFRSSPLESDHSRPLDITNMVSRPLDIENMVNRPLDIVNMLADL